MAFTPFMQGTKAQSIISDYLGGKLESTPNVNSAGMYRNPNFDLRTEQENAGTLTPEDLFPNPVIDFSVTDPETPVDPCPVGFMLVDGICQPIETFGQSMYDTSGNTQDKADPREYYSIDDMKEMDDYEFLDYLTGAGAYMTGKDGQFTLNDPMNFGMFGSGLKLLGLDSSDIRNKFMRKKLAELGYNFTNNKQGEPVYNLMQPMNIIDNAQAANQGGNRLATNQLSIFTPDEINYQIDAKNERDRSTDQQNYAREMTEKQVIDDAQQSGGSVNQFEAQNINAGGTNNTYNPSTGNKKKSKYSGNPFI